MKRKSKITEYTVRLPSNFETKIPGLLFIADEGVIVSLATLGLRRCRGDLSESISRIVEDKSKTEEIMKILEENFSHQLMDYRLNVVFDDEKHSPRIG